MNPIPLLASGSKLGHYEVIELLGAGGMSVVYRARDLRLNRDVAVKVLIPGREQDADRRQRFLKEAQAVSALQHPNIVVIHEQIAINDLDAIVMEYVAGRTLRALLEECPQGLPSERALEYGRQIAKALVKAHSAGIVHRDLKPANIMVTADGLVKVLDFGIAKLQRSVGADSGSTLTSDTLTACGTLLGTTAYMSPEQAQGMVTDARTDIFSFGIVLHEMLSGRKLFQRENYVSTLAAVLKDSPGPATQEAGDLADIVGRCLRKDRAERFQTMTEVDAALTAVDSVHARDAPRRRAGPWKWGLRVAAGIAIAISAGLGIRMLAVRTHEPARLIPLTTDARNKTGAAVSPDGRMVAYLSETEGSQRLFLFVRPVDEGRAIQLVDQPVADVRPTWSPDGKYVTFARRGGSRGYYSIPALGGSVRKVIEVNGAPGEMTWSPKGDALVYSAMESDGHSSLWLVNPASGQRRALTRPPAEAAGDEWPQFSPDGKQVAFLRRAGRASTDIHLISVSGGEPKRVTNEGHAIFGLCWSRDGREIIFASRRTLPYRLWRIDVNKGGKPVLIPESSEGSWQPEISRNTGRLVFTRRLRDVNIWRLELNENGVGKTSQRWITSTFMEGPTAYSPDGRQIAFISQRSGNAELWICDEDGRNPVQLTRFGGPHTANPRFSPDGKWLAFDTRLHGQADIFVIAAAGGEPRRVTSSPHDEAVPSWSPDGKWIYFSAAVGPTGTIRRIPSGGGELVSIGQGRRPAVGSGGEFLYFFREAFIMKQPLTGGLATRVTGPLPPGLRQLWVVGRSRLYYFAGPKELKAVPLSNPAEAVLVFNPPDPVPTDGHNLSLSPDERWLLYPQEEVFQADIMLIDNFR